MSYPSTFALCCALVIFTLASPAHADDVAGERRGFIGEVFDGSTPSQRTLWLTGELQETATQVLGHPYRALRLRYWQDERRSAWILDEIGKDLPITIGVVVADQQIEQVRVLKFRETRGGEVRYSFFTDQFRGAALGPMHQLDRPIDGITGATLSVRAVTAIARFALALDKAVRASDAREVAFK